MDELYILPLSDGFEREFEYSVEKPVSLNEHITPGEYGSLEDVRLWGLPDMSRYEEHFDQLSSGDFVIFYHDEEYKRLCKVFDKFISRDVGVILWDKSWPYILIFDDLIDTSLSREEFNETMGYGESFYPRSIQRVTEEKLVDLKETFGSIPEALRHDSTNPDSKKAPENPDDEPGSKKLSNVQIRHFTNLRTRELDGLNDLNIIIGPNNCGKSNVLRAIQKIDEFENGQAPLIDNERYLEQQRKVELTFDFSGDEITLESDMGALTTDEESSTIEDASVLYIEEGRTQQYKGENLESHLNKTFPNVDGEILYKNLSEIVDSNLQGIQGPVVGSGDVRFNWGWNEDENITPDLERHGSGMRSLAILLAEIDANDPDILLLDEPEVGLNPAAKRSLLSFLLELSTSCQIFLTTQDASFVNPLFWSSHEQSVSVYHYSISWEIQQRQPFLNVGVDEPSTFAGYLPQSTSLSDLQIFVEGRHDVRVFRRILHQYLEERKPLLDKGGLLNRVEIFHLNGNNWEHFLSTIPGHPYRSAVILDNNMISQVENVVERYDESDYENLPSFIACETISELQERFDDTQTVPIYCLSGDDISDYLNVGRKWAISEELWETNELPEEIEDVMDALFHYERPWIDSGPSMWTISQSVEAVNDSFDKIYGSQLYTVEDDGGVERLPDDATEQEFLRQIVGLYNLLIKNISQENIEAELPDDIVENRIKGEKDALYEFIKNINNSDTAAEILTPFNSISDLRRYHKTGEQSWRTRGLEALNLDSEGNTQVIYYTILREVSNSLLRIDQIIT